MNRSVRNTLYKCIFISGFVFLALTAKAQPEIRKDSLDFPTENVRKFGDFLLDMNFYTPPKLPKMDFSNLLGKTSPDYTYLFRLDPKMTFSTATMNLGYSSTSIWNGYFSSPVQMQTGSFRLNDNLRLNTYGEYDKDGFKVQNRSPYPWEKNSFRGGMELKFNNGFGIRLDVKRGYDPAYPY